MMIMKLHKIKLKVFVYFITAILILSIIKRFDNFLLNVLNDTLFCIGWFEVIEFIFSEIDYRIEVKRIRKSRDLTTVFKILNNHKIMPKEKE